MSLSDRALTYTYLSTPIGDLLLAGQGNLLELVSFPSGSRTHHPASLWRRDDAAFPEAKAQLRAYFRGDLTNFDLLLAPSGTAFQLSVWKALREIPYGATASYGDIARRIGRPEAVRAVGVANGANPLPIIVPCHRVIGSNGTLTGFGGGIRTKQFLLDLERGDIFSFPADAPNPAYAA